jgi:hypothetical protein
MSGNSIGTITLVVSENHRDGSSIDEDLAPLLTEKVVEYINHLLTRRGLEEEYAITDVQWSLGCVTIVLTIGTMIKVVAAGGLIAGGAKVLKDYKDGREGLLKILEDLKNVKLWFRKKWRYQKNASSSATSTPEPFKAIFEQMVTTYEGLPPEQRKYWAAGQEMTVMNENGDLCHYIISLKREDLHPAIDDHSPANTPEKLKKDKKKKKDV